MITPMITDSTPVQNSEAKGSASVKGSAPRIEIQITVRRPIRSPTGPPITVPRATAARNRNSIRCAPVVPSPKRSIRKKV